VLAKGWDLPLKTQLHHAEREHFRKLHNALEKKANLLNDATIPSVEIADVGEEVSFLLESTPLQPVWDNMNRRTGSGLLCLEWTAL
jgi:hypothetical protein